ncbi:nucleoside hydrolase-like [Glandiceps talaboti]
MEEKNMQIIIDCDGGHDDMEAIMVALSQPYVKVLAITCVNGATTVEYACRNVLKVLKLFDREEIPVFKGCSSSLMVDGLQSDHVHGMDGLGDVQFMVDTDTTLLQLEPAVNALVRLVQQNPGQVTLVAIGPLTNVAIASRMDPEFSRKLRRLTIMGGNIHGKGNSDYVCAEFNFAMDPEAAKIVIDSFQCPITIVPSEVCEDHSFTMNWFEDRARLGTLKSNFITETASKIIQFFERIYEASTNCPYISWDGLAMVVTVHEQSVNETERVYATVELYGQMTRGQMVIDWHGKLKKPVNITIVKKIDLDFVKEVMMKSVK